MPISIDSFQRTLDTSNVQGFVKLTNDGDGVKSVGGGFFARHFGLYTKPTAEENNAARRAFYESVVDALHCQGAVLAKLRTDLGIGDDGTSRSGVSLSVGDAKEILQRVKTAMSEQAANVHERKLLMEGVRKGGFMVGAIRDHLEQRLALNDPVVSKTKLSVADARAIRNYAMDAHTNYTVRNNLYEQLSKAGLCQGEIGTQVRDMLDLDDREKMLEPLPPQVRNAVISFAKDNSAQVHAGRLASMGLPSADALANHVAPDRLEECKAIIENTGATVAQLAKVVEAINDFSVGQEREGWLAQVDGAHRQLSSDLGIDCSALRDSVLSGIEKGLVARYNGAKTPMLVSKEQIRSDFTAELAKVVADKVALSASLDEAAAKLPQPVTDYLRSALASDPDLDTSSFKMLIDKHDAAMPLQNLRFSDNVTEADVLGAMKAMKEKMGPELSSAPNSKHLYKMLFDMAKLAIESGKGAKLPDVGAMKPALVKYLQQLVLVQGDVSSRKYLCGPAALASGILADIDKLQVFGESCGIREMGAPKAATGPEKELSPLLEKHLKEYGLTTGNHDLCTGKPFDFTLGSAFQEAMLDRFETSLSFSDKTDMYPDCGTAFETAIRDYLRLGSSLKVDDTVIARVNDVPENEQRAVASSEMIAKLDQFFGADEANGMRAARIIGALAHQGFAADILSSIQLSGEPTGIPPTSDSGHTMEFFVRRTDDGSYDIRYSSVNLYRLMMNEKGMQWLVPGSSRVSYEMDMKLSFDASGKPKISFVRPPKMSGRFTPSGMGLEDIERLQAIKDPVTGAGFSNVLELSGAQQDPEIRHAVFETDETAAEREAAFKLLDSRLINYDDIQVLNMLGFNDACIDLMISGMAGDDSVPKLGKEIIGRLKDPSTRPAAMQDLVKMMGPIVEKGWEQGIPDVAPEMVNLVTIAGLSTHSCSLTSDATRVSRFIRASNDPEVKRLPADLQSSDPEVVKVAKQRVQEILKQQRAAEGLNLLRSHLLDISGNDYDSLEKHIPPEQYQSHLDHIVAQDEHMDESLQAFRELIESAKIIAAGLQEGGVPRE